MSDSESVDPKKVIAVNWENQTEIPKMGESETFLFSALTDEQPIVSFVSILVANFPDLNIWDS
jgi:hypothetical protein